MLQNSSNDKFLTASADDTIQPSDEDVDMCGLSMVIEHKSASICRNPTSSLNSPPIRIIESWGHVFKSLRREFNIVLVW